jgi:hypothetical protein
MMIFAMDVVSDASTQRDIASTRRDRQKPAAREEGLNEFINGYPSFGADYATGRVELKNSVHAGHQCDLAIGIQGDITVAPAQASGDLRLVLSGEQVTVALGPDESAGGLWEVIPAT